MDFDQTASDIFSEINNAGEGFSWDEERPPGAVELYSMPDSLTLWAAGGKGYLVADMHGPWAVEVPAGELSDFAAEFAASGETK